MYIYFIEDEEYRPMKTAQGNTKTGLSKQVKIPKNFKPRGEGQGQRPA